MRVIDMHCHILPGLDDGSKSEQESVQMLKLAKKQGIRGLIATPHYSPSYRKSTPGQIGELCKKMEEKAQKLVDPGFRIYPGQEIFYSEDVPEKLEKKEILTMAGSQYVLTEFLPGTPYSAIERAVRELTHAQYTPILAHVERYQALREGDRVEELAEFGACMQMNYRPIGGKWYSETTRWCRSVLKEGLIDFLGTDMHNTGTRQPETAKAMVWMEKHLDKGYIQNITYKNVGKILKNEKL